jgi:lipopolysaccharide assembly protein A
VRLILVLVFLVLAVILAVQNASVVMVQVFIWHLEASLAVIIVLCVAVGAILATLALMPALFRYRRGERRLQIRVAELERTGAVSGSQGVGQPSNSSISVNPSPPVAL